MAIASLSELFSPTFLNESTIHQNLGEDFSICENGNMVFHWADFHETCDAVKSEIATNKALKDEFIQKEAALERLNLIPVWIRTEKKVHQTTMFHLYERHILNQLQLSLGVDPFGPIEISFISSTGPFKSMAIAECFNHSTYKDFVMVYLLKAKLPQRDYRIRLKSKILMEYGTDFGNADLVNLEQLGTRGILLSVSSDFYLNKLSQGSDVRLLIETNCLKEGATKNLSDLKAHLSQYAFNLMYSSSKEDSFVFSLNDASVQSSFDFLKNKKIFMFVSYDKIISSNDKITHVKNFVAHTKNLIKDHYQKSLSSKSA